MIGGVEIDGVVERVERVAGVRGDLAAEAVAIQRALRAVTELRSWLAAVEADLTSRLASEVSFPERAVADCTRGSLRDAAAVKERAETLGRVPRLAGALERGEITAGHVDALTRAGKGLRDDGRRAELFERVDALVDVAAAASVEEFRRRLGLEVRAVERDDGIARLERQRRATRLRTWVDGEGMWRFDGRFDPVLAVRLAARLDAELEARFAEAVPATCPTDPVEKQAHLRALAFAALVCGDGVGARSGRPEYVVVVDTAAPDGGGGPGVDWGLPVEIPHRVLVELADDAEIHPVVVRNGVIIHAPGQVDLGRTTRLANRAQRRALRAMYATCAIPGCAVRFDRCKIHHVVWWRHGGRTDLANLLPTCAHHHTKIHDTGWDITLGPNRELTIRFPDGTVHNTGPPTRHAA
jgi:hypothetical protein